MSLLAFFCISYVILLHEKLLQFDWLRAVVFQVNLKYLHVKITNLLWVAWFVRDIWHKYHWWYFKIVSNFTRLTAREITYNNFEISLVVFKPNITTNHAITYTNATSDISKLLYGIAQAVRQVKFETTLKYHEWYLCQISCTNHAIICLYYFPQKVCNIIFTCRYFKLSWNTTAPSQSNCKNFSCSKYKCCKHTPKREIYNVLVCVVFHTYAFDHCKIDIVIWTS